MTLVPQNARSELVMPAKCSGDGVCDTMLQIPDRFEPASCRPALSPTRGSGDGAVMSGADMAGRSAGELACDIDVAEALQAQAVTHSDGSHAIRIRGGGRPRVGSRLSDERVDVTVSRELEDWGGGSASSICCMRSISVF